MDKDKKKKRINAIYNIFLVFFIMVFLGSASYLGFYFYNIHSSEKEFQDVKDLIIQENEGNQETLTASSTDASPFVELDGKKIQRKYLQIYQQNNDFIGWLTIPDTVVDYPVVFTPDDEEFYLRKDFHKEKSTSGTLFLGANSDLETPSDNIIIYGHNMHAGTMFHTLLEYQDEDFYKEHPYFEFDSLYGDGKYIIIAAFKIQISDDEDSFKYYEFYNAENQDEFDEYVSQCKTLTPYDIREGASYGDKLITLSTCSYHVTNGRFVVVAKKVED